MPKDKIRHGDWKMREKYFQTFDYATNALYGLRTAGGIFDDRREYGSTPRMSIRMLPLDWIHLRQCWRGVALKPTAL